MIPTTLKFIISSLLEPISYALYFCVIAFWLYYHRNAKYAVLTFYFFLASFVTAKAALLTSSDSSNIIYYDFLLLISSLGISAFFFFIFNSSLKKKIAVGLACINALYFFLNKSGINESALFDSIGYSLLSSGAVILIFLYVHQILLNVSDEPISLNFDFWITSSMLVYHLSSFLIFLTFNYLTLKIISPGNYSSENRNLISKLWGVHNVLLFLSAVLTTVGALWICYRRKSQ